jgi:hypothetical protein
MKINFFFARALWKAGTRIYGVAMNIQGNSRHLETTEAVLHELRGAEPYPG